VVRFPAVTRDSSKLSKPDLGHIQPPIQCAPLISFSRGEAAAAWSLSLPRIRMSWVITPVHHTPSCRSTGTPASLLIFYTYASQAASSVFDQNPVCAVHLPHAYRTSYLPLFVMLMTTSKGTNYDPNIKNRKCLRAHHSDWLVPCFPTSDSGVNKKKSCLRPSFVEQYFRISTSARISDSVYNTLHEVHVPIRNSAPLCGRLLFPLSI
jgi:hypothetical protein